MLLHFFILLCLDYCHSTFVRLPKFRLHQLPSIMNCAAQLVANPLKFSLISAQCHMRDTLHWRAESIQDLLGRALLVALLHHTHESCLCPFQLSQVAGQLIQPPMEIFWSRSDVHQRVQECSIHSRALVHSFLTISSLTFEVSL